MAITSEMVKELRAATGAGVLDCKKALEEAKGDFDKAIQYLLEKGQADARRKQGRETREGLIESYVHPGNRVAALVEVNCETDFVARTDEFRQLAHDLAMQVVAARPLYISPEDIPPEVLEEEKRVYRAQAAATGKPEHILDKIAEGKLKKFYDEVCLLRQPFIKDPEITVQELITRSIAKLGENIVVRRFVRFEMGETT